jgi:cobalamin-dependent methionine synthase I
LDECEKQVLEVQKLTACYDTYGIVWGECLDLGFAKVTSKALSKNLEGCDKIILFAATAGAGIDRLIAKYNRLSPARAIIIQAMGAAIIEQWCDIICKQFQAEFGANKSRFSCGYGDLPLTLQRDIFAALNVTKNLGITLSDNCFMTPTKSVTAIVGVSSVSFCEQK